MFSTIFVPIDPLALLSLRYSNKQHRIALLVQLTGKQWTSLHWDLLREGLSGDVAIASDIEALTVFYRTFHAVTPETTIETFGKRVLAFPDLQLIAQQFIRVIDRIAEAEDTVPDLAARTAIGMVAFLALHQHVLARHPTVQTSGLTVNSVIAVLRSLLACCHHRITTADNAGTLASTIVLLIQSAGPEDPEVRQALHRYIASSVDVNVAADAVLELFFVPGCGIKVPSWGILTGLCDGRRLLERQAIAAETYLRRPNSTPLNPQQMRLLDVRPSTRRYLSCFCSCGCLQEGKSACSGCGRAHYFSRACQKDDWPRHRRTCKNLWQAIAALGNDQEHGPAPGEEWQ